MAAWHVVHVDVNQAGPVVGVAHCETRFLDRLPYGSIRRLLARLDVPAGLEPGTSTTVNVQDRPAGPDDDRGRGHVRRTRILRERERQALEIREKSSASVDLPIVGGYACRHRGMYRAPAVVTFHRANARAKGPSRLTGEKRATTLAS